MSKTNKQTDELTIEWASFTVAQNVSDEKFIKAAEVLETDFLNNQNGYIRRELLKGQCNQWADLVYWASPDDAKKAIKAANSNEICSQYFSLMVDVENANTGISHYKQIASWKRI